MGNLDPGVAEGRYRANRWNAQEGGNQNLNSRSEFELWKAGNDTFPT